MRIVLACLLLVTGCKRTHDDIGGVDWVGKDAASSVTKIKAAIAAHKPSDAYLECAQMANIDSIKASDTYKQVAAEYEALCTPDLQLAMLEVAVVAAEAARKAKPTAELLSECYEPFSGTAVDTLKKYKTLDDKAKALLARMTAVCPDVKY